MESNDAKITRFKDFNKSMIEIAMDNVNLKEQGIHAKVLLCSIFDSLSKSAFSEIKGNGERFKKALTEYGNWPDCERISLLHLIRAFEIEKILSPEFNELKKWSEALFFKKFPTTNSLISAERTIRKDPTLEEVKSRWPDNSKKDLQTLGYRNLDYFQHKNLFWLYRNSLVHEFRIPGKGSESQCNTEFDPYYQELSVLMDSDVNSGFQLSKQWELVYPTGFFLKITEAVLQGVATRHSANSTSPFSSYSEGSYWIPELN